MNLGFGKTIKGRNQDKSFKAFLSHKNERFYWWYLFYHLHWQIWENCSSYLRHLRYWVETSELSRPPLLKWITYFVPRGGHQRASSFWLVSLLITIHPSPTLVTPQSGWETTTDGLYLSECTLKSIVLSHSHFLKCEKTEAWWHAMRRSWAD